MAPRSLWSSKIKVSFEFGGLISTGYLPVVVEMLSCENHAVCLKWQGVLPSSVQADGGTQRNGQNSLHLVQKPPKFSSRGSAPHPAGAPPRTPSRTHMSWRFRARTGPEGNNEFLPVAQLAPRSVESFLHRENHFLGVRSASMRPYVCELRCEGCSPPMND